jgi:hypothetical protein
LKEFRRYQGYVVLPCDHEKRASFAAGEWSDITSVEEHPPLAAEPHGWGISISVSGEFQ